MRGETLRWLALGAAAALLAVLRVDRLFAVDIDMAHHYEVARLIGETFSLRIADSSLASMYEAYPKLAYVLAAVVGAPLQSTFLGMQLVSLAALALLWGAIFLALQRLPGRVARTASLLLLAMLLLNHWRPLVEVHGAEIARNFFYPQLVAQAGVWLALAAAAWMDRGGGPDDRVAVFLTCMAALCGEAHLLPALGLLGVAGGIGLARLRGAGVHSEAEAWRVRGLYLALAGAILAAVWFNPSYRGMRAAAAVEGDLILRLIPGRGGMLVLCGVVLLLSTVLLHAWRKPAQAGRRHGVVFYLGLHGAALALLCLVQWALFAFGQGSEYAIRKYAFGLYTQALLSVAVLAGLARGGAADEAAHGEGRAWAGALGLACAMAVAFHAALPGAPVFSAAAVVSLERKLTLARELALPAASAERPAIAIGLPGMPPALNYMFSNVATHTPRKLALEDAFKGNWLADPARYAYVLTAAGNADYDRRECRMPGLGGALAMVDGACLARVLGERRCEGRFDFTAAGRIDPRAISGFSLAEDHGRWTDGASATFSCKVGEAAPRRMRVRANAYLPSAAATQRVRVKIGDAAREFVFDARAPGREMQVDLPALAAGQMLRVVFETPDALAPRTSGGSLQDARMLGISVSAISFD